MSKLTKRQKDIIKASINIVANQGLHNLTITNIANTVKLTESTIYSHFKNKEQIKDYMLNYVLDFINESFVQIEDLDLNYVEKLKQYYLRLGDLIESNPDILKLFYLDIFYQENRGSGKKCIEKFCSPACGLKRLLTLAKTNNEISKDISGEILCNLTRGTLQIILNNKLFIEKYDVKKNVLEHWSYIEKCIKY